MNENSFARSGTAGGTLTVFLMNITTSDILKTVFLAVIGATVSFAVSYCLKLLIRKTKR
jgi:hypothetical protein